MLREPVSYPIFAMQWSTENDNDIVYIGGGGGAAKSGIMNGVTCCRVIVGTSKQHVTLSEYYRQHSGDIKKHANYDSAYYTLNEDDIGLQPYGYIDTHDTLVLNIQQHPALTNDILLAAADKTVIVDSGFGR
jgi:hypothetical protein